MDTAEVVTNTTPVADEVAPLQTPPAPVEEPTVEWSEPVIDTSLEDRMLADNDFFIDNVPQPAVHAKKVVNGINSAIVAGDAGEDVVEGFSRGFLESGNPIEENILSNVETGTRRLVLGLAGRTDPVIAGQAVAERVKESQDGSILAPYRAFVRTQPGSELLNKGELEEAAYAAYTQHKMAQVWDELSTGEAVTDFVQMALLPTDNWKMKELAEYFGLPFDAGDFVLKGDFVKQFAHALRSMPVENRAHIFEKVVDKWETIGGFDNKMELMGFLARMEGIDDTESALMFFESAADLASLMAAPKAVAGAVKTAKGLKNVVQAVAQNASTLRRVAATGNVDLIADTTLAGARGELKTVGIAPLDAANTMTPFSTTRQLTMGAPENVAAEILAREEVFARIADEATVLPLPIDDAQKQAIIDKVTRQVTEQDNVTDFRILSRDDEGFSFAYNTVLGEQTQKVVFKPTDVGTWEDLTYRHYGIFGSPNFKFPGITKDLVEGPQVALHAGSRIRKHFDQVLKSALGSLSAKQAGKVESLLAFGEGNKVFSYSEAVGTGVNGIKYTPEEFKAYATMRQAFDKLADMKEQGILRKYQLDNVKQLDFNGTIVRGKVYEAAQDATQGVEQGTRYSKWYIKDGKLMQADLTSDILKDAYLNGYKLVKTDAMQLHKAGHNAAEWMLVKGDKLSEVSGPILNRIPGYVTRINDNANFFLKKKVSLKIGGKDVEEWITEAYDSVWGDLEDYRKTLQDPDNYRVFRDRELSGGQFDNDVIQTFGGLFTGKRASTPIPFGPGKKAGKQKPVMESLQRYIQNVARTMPIEIYREGLRQKWINTAIENGALSGYKGVESFNAMEGLLNPNHEKYFFFKKSYDEVKFVTGIRSLDEQEWASRIHHMGRWFEKSKIPFTTPITKFFYNGKLQDIAGGLKTATYHTLLGLFNPAQPFIQFSGALYPIAANPVHGMKGLYGAMELTTLDYLSRFGNINTIPATKVNSNLWKLWNKSGMGDTLLHANVDYYSMFGDVPYNAAWYKKILPNSDLGVKIGEAGYTRVSFATAYEHVQAQLGRVPTESDIPAIISRAEQYKFNMSRANTAQFQRGGVSSFTGMFMQVQTKFLEKMIGSDFTAAEKLRMGAAQIAMYGAVGTPIIGTLAPAIMSMLGVDTTDPDITADELSAYQKGALGWFISDYLGTNAEISGRLSLGNDFLEKTMGIILSPTMSAPVEMLAGASWATLTRTADALQKTLYTSSVILNADNVSTEMMLGGAQVIAQEFATIPASMRNALKGYVMYNSKMFHDSKGLPVFHYRDPSFAAALAQSLGFQNMEAKDWYAIPDGGSVFNKPSARENYAKTMASIITKLINADVDRQDVYAAAYNAMASAALQYEGGEDVLKKTIKYLETPKTSWNDQFIKGLGKYQAEYVEGLEGLLKRANIRSNVTLGRAMEQYGVK